MQLLSLLIVTALSAESLALRVQQGTRSSPVSEDRIDLVPPKFESISQYNQPQTLSQVLGIHQHSFIQPIVQQQGPIAPFLYLGPLIYSNNPRVQQQQPNNHQESLRENSRVDHEQENTYVIYRPTAEEEHELVDLLPPPVKQEPNYYSLKPRKFKKYQEDKKNSPKSVEDLKKRIKIAEIESADDELEQPRNLNSEEIHRSLSENIRAARDLLTAASDDDYEIKESPPTSRLDFQMHGHKGPKSYKFGYDTGENSEAKRNNRQFRVEERNEKGEVFGRYGYYDRKGKLRVVNYASTAKDGFKIL